MAKRRAPDRSMRFEVPFGAVAANLANPGLGIARLLARGEPASYQISVTILDAPDHRLVRAGVLLAHRVVDGIGEWYLAAPGWQPYLPVEEIEPIHDDDIPDRFGELTKPFRRGAVVGPTAALTCRRQEYVVPGERGVVARLRDERVTIRRGGLTTARYREVTLTPEQATDTQLAWLEEAMIQIGAARVEAFPTFVARMGAPAMGGPDIPEPREVSPDDTLATFVSALLGTHLHTITAADLAVRSGRADSVAGVREALEALAADVRGLTPILDPAWVADVLADTRWVLERPDSTPAATLLGDRYLRILDNLVPAARSPRLGVIGRRPAAEVLAEVIAADVAEVVGQGASLAPDGPDADWEAMRTAVVTASWLAAVARYVLGRQAKRLRRRLDEVAADLEDCVAVSTVLPRGALDGLDALAGFERGRQFERDVATQRQARERFLASWRGASRWLTRRGIGA